jgi:hypothetical protein
VAVPLVHAEVDVEAVRDHFPTSAETRR